MSLLHVPLKFYFMQLLTFRNKYIHVGPRAYCSSKNSTYDLYTDIADDRTDDDLGDRQNRG